MNYQGREKVIKVAIVEDNGEIREGLSQLIGGTRGFACTRSYRTMEAALQAIGQDLPDVVLVDLGLPGMSGIEGIRKLKEIYPSLLFLVLTIYEDDRRIFEALCAGASGYIVKKAGHERLLEGIREIMAGGAAMSPCIAKRVVELFKRFHPPGSADHNLTSQEVQILSLLVEGHNFKAIADALSISFHTVSTHAKHIYQKLQVHSKSEAVAKALRDRLVC